MLMNTKLAVGAIALGDTLATATYKLYKQYTKEYVVAKDNEFKLAKKIIQLLLQLLVLSSHSKQLRAMVIYCLQVIRLWYWMLILVS